MKAYLKNTRISPKKLRVVAQIIRWKNIEWSLNFLKFAPKKWAEILYKVVSSAVANATNNDWQEKGNLYIDNLIITKGIVYKRGQAISRGRSHPILKRTSNVRLELQVK